MQVETTATVPWESFMRCASQRGSLRILLDTLRSTQCSSGSSVREWQGAMTHGYASSATDDAIQKNIVSAGYSSPNRNGPADTGHEVRRA